MKLLEMSVFTTYHLFLVVKTIAPTPAIIRFDAEDVGEHSLRRVNPTSSASKKKRKNAITDTISVISRRISSIFMIMGSSLLVIRVGNYPLEMERKSTFPFKRPNPIDETKLELKKVLQGRKKFFSVLNLRSHFCCKFDYYRPQLEDK